jgi:hypothetical protein
MSCPKTQHLLQEYFADDLTSIAKEGLSKHLAECKFCEHELESLLFSQDALGRWQDRAVPHWDRGLALFRQEHGVAKPSAGFWSRWQWLPTASSFAMLCVLLLNVSVNSNDQGFSIAFGGRVAVQQDIEPVLAAFRDAQREEMQALVARVEDRQDNNNVRMIQAVMDQTQQSTAENFETMYSYFEDQRVSDLQSMRLGFQELVDSDYETIRSLQQLVNYVGYTDNVR